MAVSCLRVTTAAFTLLVILSISLVSFEVDVWSLGGDSTTTTKKFFAEAAPLAEDTVNILTDGMDDVDLHADGKRQHDREISEYEKDMSDSQSHPETQPKAEVRQEESPPGNDVGENGQEDDVKVHSQSLNEGSEWTSSSNNDDKPSSEASLTTSAEQDDQTREASTSTKRRKRAKTFLVVFMGHSGSTAFTTELRTHSEFLVELLEPLEHGEFEFDTDKALSRARELMDRGISQGKIPGFKIRPFHVSNKPELWREFVREYDTRIIWQYRENIIKQAVGEYRNRFLNDTSVVEGLMIGEEPCLEGSGQICKFKIEDFEGLHGLMNDFSKSDELLTGAVRNFRRDNEMHVVRYEDYLYNRENTMRSAFDFLGVDYQSTRSGRRKASPDSLCEMVVNFQDLCDRFVQCQLWRPFLSDEKNDCRCEAGKWQPFDSSFCRREAWYQKRA